MDGYAQHIPKNTFVKIPSDFRNREGLSSVICRIMKNEPGAPTKYFFFFCYNGFSLNYSSHLGEKRTFYL